MAAFQDGTGNLLAADVDALVNPVNTVGVMGRGLALQFKRAFPANFTAYEQACRRREVRAGKMFVYDNGQMLRPHWIINFPTKKHWSAPSEISDIAAGLRDLRRVIDDLEITSIAMPAIGCGLGGLDWADVKPLIEECLDETDVAAALYRPQR